ncbi:MAG: ABC transporter permease [Adhaeribacter sp.]
MARLLLRRLLLLVPAVWLIGSVVFLLSRTIPGTFRERWAEADQSAIGGPASPGFPQQEQAPQENRHLPLFYWGLQPQAKLPAFTWHGLHNQYHLWLVNLLHGDLGYSYRDRQPVAAILGAALGYTLWLLGGSVVLLFLLSTELSLALIRAGRGPWRQLVLSVLFALDSIPLFLLALVLLVLLAGTGYLNLFPLFGLGYAAPDAGAWEVFSSRLHHLLLPGLCLVLSGMPYVTTQLVRFLQQVEQAPFITTARAKGLPPGLVLRRHMLRNALLPLITLFTGFLPSLISGAVVVEMVFALPGTGRLLADSVLARDYPVVLGLVLLLATVKAASHLLADLLYFAADPRTRPKTT